jgi:hypothetical protein
MGGWCIIAFTWNVTQTWINRAGGRVLPRLKNNGNLLLKSAFNPYIRLRNRNKLAAGLRARARTL